MKRPCVAAGLALLTALPFAGCGGQSVKLSGRVLFEGKPLPGGRLTFRPADPRQNAVPVLIDADGHYEATLPVGDVAVCVDNRELDPAPRRPGQHALPPGAKLPPEARGASAPAPSRTGSASLPGTYVPIPERFYDADTSGLRFTVKKGEDKYDIELK